MKIYDLQTITLTQAAASEAIAEAFNRFDPIGSPIAELSRDILRRLGFEVSE